MAVLQELFALVTRSAGKILNAIFGWAVHALFGQTSTRQQTALSGLVAAAVAWPLLLVGVAAPKVAARVLAFIPIPPSVPSWSVRLVWVGLALAVPIVVGLVVTAKAPPMNPPESRVKRFLRGFPITLGLAAAFLIMFVSVPIMRLVTALRGRKSADVPLTTQADAYHQTAAAIVETLNRHGFELRKTKPSWWVSAPTRILSWFGGNAFRRFVPENPEHYESPELVLSFYTSGALLRGVPRAITWAHGLIAEDAAGRDAYLTIDPAAQRLEAQIRRVWRVYDQEVIAHRGSARLLGRITEMARELGETDVTYEDWQVLYRQLLQLERAVHGQRQLLESSNLRGSQKEAVVESEVEDKRSDAGGADDAGRGEGEPGGVTSRSARSVAELSNVDLIKEITGQVGLLAKKQIELAKTELRADVKSEVAMASGLGVAALAAIVTINMLLVTVILALAQEMPGWGAGLLVSAVTLGIAGVAALIGWNKRVRTPLEKTRRTLKEDAQWTKERLA